MRNDYWHGKSVYITGATGFVGSALVAYLSASGAMLRVLARRPVVGQLTDVIPITDRDLVYSALKQAKPDVVYHLAAEALVETGEEHPYDTFVTNFQSTLNVLESCRRLSVPRIVLASTVHVYGRTAVPISEEEPPRPSRPYETSKTCADIIAQSYADTFDLPVVIGRFCNIYGPGDRHPSRIVPKVIRQVVSGRPAHIWGGGAIREYLYVDDAIRAYALLGKMDSTKLERNRIFNFGTGEPVTVRDLVTRLLVQAGSDQSIEISGEGRPDEIPDQRVSWEKAARILGWQPTVGLDEGLRRTIDWHRNSP